MKILLNFHLASDVRLPVPPEVLDALRARFPQLAFVAADDEETLAREATDADVFFGWRFPAALLDGARRLRWIQAASAGIEGHPAQAIVAKGIILTNAAGVAAPTIAEHVLALMLALCRNLHVAYRLQRDARWDRPAVMMGTGTSIREFRGSAVAVLGLGPIGMEVAARAAALGAIIRGCRRRPDARTPPGFQRVVGPEGLDDLLAWADFVVVALPHTPATDRMLGRERLRRMKGSAYLVNVGRGAVVDEAALMEALDEGAIAGAALDVFADEPLPASSRLWAMPNVIVTPHVAGARPRYLELAVELFIANLTRYVAGAPLLNRVDPIAGYPLSD